MDKTEQQEKCLACRECCEYVEIPTTMLSMEVVEYWYVRGEQFYINPTSGVFSVRIYKPCVHLKEDGCAIYDNRPKTYRLQAGTLQWLLCNVPEGSRLRQDAGSFRFA